MNQTLSKSEKKRRAKGIEQLVQELVKLSPTDIKRLPCDDFIRQEILDARAMKAGARKRQVKYITKYLRKNDDSDALFTFMAEQKGSKLKQNKEFHALEHLRDEIVTEVIEACREAELMDRPFDSGWHIETIEQAAREFASLDRKALKTAAVRYANTRKAAFSREIFRLLKAAHEQEKFNA